MVSPPCRFHIVYDSAEGNGAGEKKNFGVSGRFCGRKQNHTDLIRIKIVENTVENGEK